jgi:transcriptional regulator with XRE-family HTH domain
MIKNEREYRITKAQAKDFERALDNLRNAPARADVHPVLQRAELDALRSQLDDLREQVQEYEALKAGNRHSITAASFSDLPAALIQARIAAGLSQKDLAEKLGLKEQQIQRYEATDYAGASLTRLNQIIEGLNVRIHKDVYLPTRPVSADAFYARAKELGLDRDFVLDRLVTPQTAAILRDVESYADDDTMAVASAAATLDHIFDLPTGGFLGATPPTLNAGAVQFKLPARIGRGFAAYTAYAYYLARTLLAAFGQPQRTPTNDPASMRSEIIQRYGDLSLRSALSYTWDLGIPVLPLSLRGTFHGACWRLNFQHVIVLKQRTPSHARWLHDLLHELKHSKQNADQPNFAVIETGDSPLERARTPEEEGATEFASAVMLDGRQESLAEEVVEEAQGRIEYLKRIVPIVAQRRGVDTGALANYIAFRLALQGENWWGTATNLQERDEQPWRVARDVFCERMVFDRLAPFDLELLQQALRP